MWRSLHIHTRGLCFSKRFRWKLQREVSASTIGPDPVAGYWSSLHTKYAVLPASTIGLNPFAGY
ncbi:MAG: hypothetical protein GIS02_00210 [Methanosarcinales archaeon]|uniref:Uncharacterized protein n=1 Tax=Candidatus Ethanoperedens thermophilum TaxID=2766897 RepID=A0A848D6X9_9EURY|nr:hypothetical protein [Candidatus Ethanoperedens thermophilum]